MEDPSTYRKAEEMALEGLTPGYPEPRIENDFRNGIDDGGLELSCAICGDNWIDDAPGSMTMHAVPVWSYLDHEPNTIAEYEKHVREKHPHAQRAERT